MRRFVQHPGYVLACFLDEAELSQNLLARALGVPPRRINEIILGKRGISADTAIALNELFGMGEPFWMHLQNDWDLEKARRRREVRPRVPTARPGEISLDFLVLLASGKYRTGFQAWLEKHQDRMTDLQRGTRIYDEPIDHELECYRRLDHSKRRVGD
jgi:addiction module HigA family antidote